MIEVESLGSLPLSDVIVRPIQRHERARWDALMGRHHYLGFKQTVGRALRQVAEYRAGARRLPALIPQARTVIRADGDRPGPCMANDHGELPFGGFLQPNRPNIPLQAGKPHYAKALDLDQAG